MDEYPNLTNVLIESKRKFLIYERNKYFEGVNSLHRIVESNSGILAGYNMPNYYCKEILTINTIRERMKRFNFHLIARFTNFFVLR